MVAWLRRGGRRGRRQDAHHVAVGELGVQNLRVEVVDVLEDLRQ